MRPKDENYREHLELMKKLWKEPVCLWSFKKRLRSDNFTLQEAIETPKWGKPYRGKGYMQEREEHKKRWGKLSYVTFVNRKKWVKPMKSNKHIYDIHKLICGTKSAKSRVITSRLSYGNAWDVVVIPRMMTWLKRSSLYRLVKKMWYDLDEYMSNKEKMTDLVNMYLIKKNPNIYKDIEELATYFRSLYEEII